MKLPLELSQLPAELAERLARVRLLVLDVDGTLTDGGIYYGSDGVELQRFDVRDGLGLVLLKQAGVRLAWITGRGSAATERRARELGVDCYVPHSGPKLAALERVRQTLGAALEETLAMGDDLPDLELFEGALTCACPSDAAAQVRSIADLVLSRAGGCGAVRELCDLLLAAKQRISPPRVRQ